MVFGKTTIMRILQNLMNFNFNELIKYDFESIDIEVSAKKGEILKDTINYAALLPTDEEIKNFIMQTEEFYDDLYQSWENYKENVSDEEKISCFDDDLMTNEEKIDAWDEDSDMYEEFDNGNVHTTIIDVLDDLSKKNVLKNIMRKIIKKEKFDDLFYEQNINKHNIYKDQYYWFGHIGLQYYDAKNEIEKIIKIIKKFLENRLISNKEISFDNKKNITKMIKTIKDNVDKNVDILDMTKVYNFENESLTSSLITNKLLEWKSAVPYKHYNFLRGLEQEIYKDVLNELEYICNDSFDNKSKDISELNNSNIIEINSIVNHYFYNEDFIIDINKKALAFYIVCTDSEYSVTIEEQELKTQKGRDEFIKYIRPVILRNSPFDMDWNEYQNFKESFCKFYEKEWHSFEENINPKMKILQKLLDKYMMNKDVEVTPMGILVKSKDDNRNIPLNSLSSGEKKLIVIFMHCLFNEDVPIIIDEPEISLSIIWQENLLPDLLEKTNIKQVIVATHSSAVISDSSLDKYIIPLPNSIVDKGGNSNE